MANIHKLAIIMSLAMSFTSVIAFAQNPEFENSILRYNISDLDGGSSVQIETQDTTQPGQQPTQPAQPIALDLISQLLSNVGKKEKKIINQLLIVGKEKKLFDMEKLEKKLGKINIPAIMNLYSNLKALKIKKFDLNKLGEIKGMLANIDSALKQAKGSPIDYGNLSFFAGLTRDQLANYAPTNLEKSQLRFSAVNNYNDTIKNLAKQKDVASKEKVDDAKERVVTLKTPFGNVIPISSKRGTGKIFITSDYGMRVHPVKKTRRFHSGVDLAGWKCKGWKVVNIGPGRVVKSGWESGYGYVVIISHEIEGKQYYSRYAHLKKSKRLKNGKIVKRGDTVGYCNNSGISTGSHLHFEVREESFSGKTMDPKTYLPTIKILK